MDSIRLKTQCIYTLFNENIAEPQQEIHWATRAKGQYSTYAEKDKDTKYKKTLYKE